LVSQGFEEEMVAEALKQSNNNPERSYHLLTAETELLRLAVHNSKPPYIPSEEDIIEIMHMGFTRPQAYGTLKLTRGDLSGAVEKLLSGEGREEEPPIITAPFPPIIAPFPPVQPIISPTDSSTTEGSTDITPVPMVVEETPEEKEKKAKEATLQREAEHELLGDVEEDPLISYDIDLTDEAQFISHFSALINASL